MCWIKVVSSRRVNLNVLFWKIWTSRQISFRSCIYSKCQLQIRVALHTHGGWSGAWAPNPRLSWTHAACFQEPINSHAVSNSDSLFCTFNMHRGKQPYWVKEWMAGWMDGCHHILKVRFFTFVYIDIMEKIVNNHDKFSYHTPLF